MESEEVDCLGCPALKVCSSNYYKFVSLNKNERYDKLVQKTCYAMQYIFSKKLNVEENYEDEEKAEE